MSAPAGAKPCHAAPGTWGDMGWPRAPVSYMSHRDPWLSGTPGLDSSTSLFFPSASPALPGSWSPALASAVLTEKGEHSASQPLPMLQSMLLTQGVSAPLVAEMHSLAVTSITLACHIF